MTAGFRTKWDAFETRVAAFLDLSCSRRNETIRDRLFMRCMGMHIWALSILRLLADTELTVERVCIKLNDSSVRTDRQARLSGPVRHRGEK